MTVPGAIPVARSRWPGWATAAALAALLPAGCGGGGNPVGNPPTIANPQGATGQKLSFVYFQKCIDPIFQAQLQIDQNGVISTNSCSGSGCHDNTNGTGGAFRVIGQASPIDPSNPANTPDVIRASDMYKNYYSAQGEVIPGNPAQSRLVNKPLVRTVLHGGGLIFASETDPNVQRIEYWINRPVPAGQDEFSASASTMFTPQDPVTGTCNTN
jgi:hypothetical protein